MVPFRYKGAPTARVYSACWEPFGKLLLAALAPDLIVPLGKNHHRTLAELYRGKGVVVEGVCRSRGDRYLTEEGIQTLRRAAAIFKAGVRR